MFACLVVRAVGVCDCVVTRFLDCLSVCLIVFSFCVMVSLCACLVLCAVGLRDCAVNRFFECLFF